MDLKELLGMFTMYTFVRIVDTYGDNASIIWEGRNSKVPDAIEGKFEVCAAWVIDNTLVVEVAE